MTQSTIHAFANSLPQLTLKRSWSVGSAVAIVAAIILSITAFAFNRAETSQVILIGVIATFLIVTIVHARFISFAQGQNRQTTELLWNKEREFQSIFENALDAILVLDDNGICQSANPSASIFFSMRRDRLIGQPIDRFYPVKPEFDSMWNRLRADRRFQGEMELIRADGAPVIAEFTAMAGIQPNCHLMIFRDVTSRRRAQQAANQSLMAARSSWQEAEALRKASVALTEDLRMNNVLDALLQTLADFVPYDRAQLFLLENETRFFLAHEATHPLKPTLESGFPDVFDIADFPILRKVVASPEGIRIDDVTNETTWRPIGKERPFQSWIGVPIISSNQVLGLLCLTASHPSHFSANHLALTRSLATPAAVAIQNARLYERAEIYGAELERRVAELQQIDQRLTSRSGDPKSLERFETIFRSAPVAISVSSLANGRLLEANETFERTFGFRHEEITSGTVTELELWGDPRERTKLIERLGRGSTVRNAVARFRRDSGSFGDTMYSAQMIELEGEPCILFVAEDQTA